MERIFEWSERKRATNLRNHGIDFSGRRAGIRRPHLTFEDDRFRYDEQRFVTLGLFDGVPVSIAHTEKDYETRIILFRKATRRGAQIYFQVSKTDLKRLRSGEPGHPTREHPEANVNHIVNGIVRKGLEPQPGKAAFSIRVDQDVLEWFKSRGRGYQTRINSVLRAFRDASL